MDGELEAAGDQWRLRFTRELAHEPAQVWRAMQGSPLRTDLAIE